MLAAIGSLDIADAGLMVYLILMALGEGGGVRYAVEAAS
jgi:hypothetical protein